MVWGIFKGVLAEALTPFQATNQQLANATSYGQIFGQALGIILGVLGEVIVTLVKFGANTIFTVVGTAIGVFGWMSLIPERVSSAFSSVKASVMEAGAAFINSYLPLRQVIGGYHLISRIRIKREFVIPNSANPSSQCNRNICSNQSGTNQSRLFRCEHLNLDKLLITLAHRKLVSQA